MTPFELQLLQTAWPIISNLCMAFGAWYLRDQARRMAAITTAVADLAEKIAEIDKGMITGTAVMQHKLDKLAGHVGERVGVIEAVVDHKLPGGLQRRATDRPAWDEQSDVNISGHRPV